MSDDPPSVPADQVRELAQLIRERNAIDLKISQILQRPAGLGHIGEFIAANVFDIELHKSATAMGSDGVFRTGPLAGRQVNIKIYGKRENLLDLKEVDGPEYYLVLTGPSAAAVTSRGTTRPLVIDHVYLFKGDELLAGQRQRGVKIGVASSVPAALWSAANVYPEDNAELPLTQAQRELLAAFASPRGDD